MDGSPLPVLSLSASTKDGRALISLTHLGADAGLDVRLDLGGQAVEVLRARVLTGDGPAAHNTPDDPRAVTPLDLATRWEDGLLVASLPPHSFATIELGVESDAQRAA